RATVRTRRPPRHAVRPVDRPWPPRGLQYLDHHRTAMAERVQRRRPVGAAAHARTHQEAEREDLLAEVPAIEGAPEDRLVERLQLGEREGPREEGVDQVGVLELGAQAAERGADDGVVVVGEGWQPRGAP